MFCCSCSRRYFFVEVLYRFKLILQSSRSQALNWHSNVGLCSFFLFFFFVMFILDRFVHFLMAEVRCFSVCRMSPKILILLAAVWRFLVFLLNLEVFCCFIAKMSEFLDWEHHWFWWNSYLFEYHTTRDIPPCWSSFWRWRPNWRFSQFAAGCLTKQSYNK